MRVGRPICRLFSGSIAPHAADVPAAKLEVHDKERRTEAERGSNVSSEVEWNGGVNTTEQGSWAPGGEAEG